MDFGAPHIVYTPYPEKEPILYVFHSSRRTNSMTLDLFSFFIGLVVGTTGSLVGALLAIHAIDNSESGK